jgi:hypothetical protein
MMICAPGFAYTVDGDLSDWGVTPFSDWIPNANVSYTVANWGDPDPLLWGTQPFGGEQLDVEAGYAVVQGDYLFAAIVTSFPESGRYIYGYLVMPGDLAVDVDQDGVYEYAVVGQGSAKGEVYKDPVWTLPHGFLGVPAGGPSTAQPGTGTFMGTGSLVYTAGATLPPELGRTYVIEMAVPLSFLGDGEGWYNLHYTITCGNDVVAWSVYVPEPASVALLGCSGLLLLRRRR